MIIYQIYNRINRKSYVGQTIYDSFKERYDGGKWYNTSHNKYLKKAVAKYGLDNFEVIILEENVGSIDQLNALEEYYINIYNCIFPNGYNFKHGGNNKSLTEEVKEKIKASGVKTRNKSWTFFNHKTEELVTISNLSQFCRENNLSDKNMIHLTRGFETKLTGRTLRKRVGCWTLPGVVLKKWKVKSPSGEVYTILEGELNKFCRQFNLHKNGIICLFKTDKFILHSYKGWTKAL